MSTLLAVCLVTVTISVLALTVTVIRAMGHVRKASDELTKLSEEGRLLVDRVTVVARDAGEIVGTFREVAPRVRRVVEHIESIGERTVDLSDAVIQEVEGPIRTAIAVARGVRFGAKRLVEHWIERFSSRSGANGGEYDE
jgi:uncharacterized protein YoxC